VRYTHGDESEQRLPGSFLTPDLNRSTTMPRVSDLLEQLSCEICFHPVDVDEHLPKVRHRVGVGRATLALRQHLFHIRCSYVSIFSALDASRRCRDRGLMGPHADIDTIPSQRGPHTLRPDPGGPTFPREPLNNLSCPSCREPFQTLAAQLPTFPLLSVSRTAHPVGEAYGGMAGGGEPSVSDRCPVHPDERLKGYCEREGCRVAVCSSCVMFDHRDASHK
jgi:hypothetical protein